MLTEIESSVDSPHTSDRRIARLAPQSDWQTQLKEAVRSLDDLLDLLRLSPGDLEREGLSSAPFPLRVPLSFVRRMRPGDPKDPLLRQVLPTRAETDPQPGYSDDPLAEQGQNPAPGVIHKYRGRALLVSTQACAVHCRYCFRQHFPYSDNRLSRDDWHQALDYLAGQTDLNEVILSGGDPLAMNDRLLSRLVRELDGIPHLRRLRLHTRLPVVIPQRVDDNLQRWLGETRLQTVVVLHINHSREIDADVCEAMRALKDTGATLLNQSVLLRDINDRAETLATLSEALFDAGILPYYIHAFDRVEGAAHFAVSDDRGRALMRELLELLPGFLVPRLVREVPGAASKWPLDLGLL